MGPSSGRCEDAALQLGHGGAGRGRPNAYKRGPGRSSIVAPLGSDRI